jgi:hypothetical protein
MPRMQHARQCCTRPQFQCLGHACFHTGIHAIRSTDRLCSLA